VSESLESKALSGGFVLVGRQLFGMVLSVAGMLVNTRLLGPQKYGQFAIVLGLMGYAANIGKSGLDVYLIRHQGELHARDVGVTQSLYLIIGCLILTAGVVTGPLAALWYKDPTLAPLFWAYAIVPPITIMSGIPIALLDRQLAYKKAAAVELAAQVLYLGISMPIICYNNSVWGLVLGAVGQALLTLFLSAHLAGMRFYPRWDKKLVRSQLKYGVGYAASIWIWQARDLVNPLIVGSFLGPGAVAYVAMAIRLSQMVGFAKTAVWRVYMSYLARLGDNRVKMKDAVESGINHQVLILAVSFITFFTIAPEIIKGLMGARWLPLLSVFPFIAAALVVNAGFSLHSSALYVIGKNRDVSVFHLVHILVFYAASLILIPITGNISGYGWAEVAAFSSYLVIRRTFRFRFFRIDESVMLFNIVSVLCLLTILSLMMDNPLWQRLASSGILLLLLLFAVSQNRKVTILFIQKMQIRFGFRC